MPARREAHTDDISAPLRHYLERGCWAQVGVQSGPETFALFMLSARVLHGHLAALRDAWRDFGPIVKAGHPAETFAEAMLAGRLAIFDTATWPRAFGRRNCLQHPILTSNDRRHHVTPLVSDMEATRRRLDQLDERLHFDRVLPAGLSVSAASEAIAIARRELDRIDSLNVAAARRHLERIRTNLAVALGMDEFDDDSVWSSE
jgi:hypothetical protein